MNKLIALWMGERDGDKPWNLNYDSPDHFARLTKRLFENTLLYERFEYYAGTAWANSGTDQYLIQWLFQPDQLRYTRFVTLFAEFLRLPETRRKFEREIIGSDQNNEALKKLVFGQKNLPADVAKLINENFDGLKQRSRHEPGQTFGAGDGGEMIVKLKFHRKRCATCGHFGFTKEHFSICKHPTNGRLLSTIPGGDYSNHARYCSDWVKKAKEVSK